ncbi:MAG TPA: hypothetical protein VN784_03925 [Candidatus Limnocylindrales bacterium]|nr:hypothetical protein [Candidatus Limnocylindrales bacterium]
MNPKLLLCLALVLGAGLNCPAAIIYPKAPNGGQQVIHETFRQGLSRSISRYLGGYQIEDLTIANPFRDYSVGLTNLVTGQLLPAARAGTWRYLLMHGTNAVGAAELMADPTNSTALIFASLDTTDLSRETMEALRTVETLPQIQKQDYELRRLDCPSILFVAVWLHGKSDDIIIPLPKTFGRWNAYQPYSESEMIELLQPEAEKRLKARNGTVD